MNLDSDFEIDKSSISKLSKKDLIQQYKTYYEMVKIFESYRVQDVMYLLALEGEIGRRGYTIRMKTPEVE